MRCMTYRFVPDWPNEVAEVQKALDMLNEALGYPTKTQTNVLSDDEGITVTIYDVTKED